MTTTTTHPLICKSSEVLALLGGATQFRRPVEPQPPEVGHNGGKLVRVALDPRHPSAGDWDAQYELDNPIVIGKCPWGVPGDVIVVKETWSPDHEDFYPHFPTVYKADYPLDIENGKVFSPEANRYFDFRWRSGSTMPAHLSRLTLEVVGVRVERVQEITPDQAIACGATRWAMDEGDRRQFDEHGQRRETPLGPNPFDGTQRQVPYLVNAFAEFWSSLHPGSWERNGYCWIVDVRRVEDVSS